VVAVVWAAKLGAVALGAAFIAAGCLLMRYGHLLMPLLRNYEKYHYPPWWWRFFGGVVVGFGVLIAVVGGLLAGR